MLHLTNNLLRYFPICVSFIRNGDKTGKHMVRTVIIRITFDSIIVCGMVFFSTFPTLGYNDMWENIRISLTSALFAGGLSFFTELKKNRGKLIKD